MQESDAVRLRHMLDAAREAISFGGNRRISDDFRAAHPEIPWADIVGMRNRLIHVYFDIDLDRLSGTITTDLGNRNFLAGCTLPGMLSRL